MTCFRPSQPNTKLEGIAGSLPKSNGILFQRLLLHVPAQWTVAPYFNPPNLCKSLSTLNLRVFCNRWGIFNSTFTQPPVTDERRWLCTSMNLPVSSFNVCPKPTGSQTPTCTCAQQLSSIIIQQPPASLTDFVDSTAITSGPEQETLRCIQRAEVSAKARENPLAAVPTQSMNSLQSGPVRKRQWWQIIEAWPARMLLLLHLARCFNVLFCYRTSTRWDIAWWWWVAELKAARWWKACIG